MIALQTAQHQFYADTVNNQFHKNQSHYVGLAQRLRESVNGEPWKQTILDEAIDEFKSKFAQIEKWEDFIFCRADETTLDKIEIDITLQRVFDLIHACNIMGGFKQLMVMPICVYEEPSRPGKYVCWDGQHTALVLYIIASKVLGLDISKCKIPIVVYASNLKAEMRECFITLNGPEGKKSLDHIDKVHQKIFGVRTDGSTNTEWKLVNEKQIALEGSKIFLTHTKFGDTDKPGAYTRLDEFLDPIYDLEITQHFAKYFFRVCHASRPVQPKESWMIYEYFRLCKVSGITVDDKYIAGVAKSLSTAFNGDFDAGELYGKAKRSYQNWWRLNKPNPDGSLLGISYPEHQVGMTFLLKQVEKNFTGQVPKLKYPLWAVPAKDLF
jgi:hypothetical protein